MRKHLKHILYENKGAIKFYSKTQNIVSFKIVITGRPYNKRKRIKLFYYYLECLCSLLILLLLTLFEQRKYDF